MPEAAAAIRRFRRPKNFALWIGSSILLGFALLAVLGERIAPHDPTAQDLFAIMQAPSRAHLFGADGVGRDILSRIIAGARYTLSIAVASVFFASLGGVALGSIAGYFGGWIDRVVTGFIDRIEVWDADRWPEIDAEGSSSLAAAGAGDAAAMDKAEGTILATLNAGQRSALQRPSMGQDMLKGRQTLSELGDKGAGR